VGKLVAFAKLTAAEIAQATRALRSPKTPAHAARAAYENLHPIGSTKAWQNGRMRPLTFDLRQEERRPYFLWDEDVSVAELRRALQGSDADERDRLLGKMLREARDVDVWTFVTPEAVAEALPGLARRLGRRAPFWTFLIEGWKKDGLL
jgi:hypothetical protein